MSYNWGNYTIILFKMRTTKTPSVPSQAQRLSCLPACLQVAAAAHRLLLLLHRLLHRLLLLLLL